MSDIASYYISKYGEPDREADFVSSNGKKVEIYKWDMEQTREGVVMYATIGANEALGSNKSGCEFFIGLTPAADSIVHALAEVALHGNGTTEVPSCGDTITLVYDLWNGTAARSFMFTDGEEIIPSFQNNDKNIKFIQLVPLFEEELLYKRKHGEDALWERFIEKEVPYWDSSRKSAFQ